MAEVSFFGGKADENEVMITRQTPAGIFVNPGFFYINDIEFYKYKDIGVAKIPISIDLNESGVVPDISGLVISNCSGWLDINDNYYTGCDFNSKNLPFFLTATNSLDFPSGVISTTHNFTPSNTQYYDGVDFKSFGKNSNLAETVAITVVDSGIYFYTDTGKEKYLAVDGLAQYYESVAKSDKNKTIFITRSDVPEILVINGDTFELLTKITNLNACSGVYFSEVNEKLYINEVNNIAEIDINTLEINRLGVSVNQTYPKMAYRPTTNSLFLCQDNGCVLQLDFDTHKQTLHDLGRGTTETTYTVADVIYNENTGNIVCCAKTYYDNNNYAYFYVIKSTGQKHWLTSRTLFGDSSEAAHIETITGIVSNKIFIILNDSTAKKPTFKVSYLEEETDTLEEIALASDLSYERTVLNAYALTNSLVFGRSYSSTTAERPKIIRVDQNGSVFSKELLWGTTADDFSFVGISKIPEKVFTLALTPEDKLRIVLYDKNLLKELHTFTEIKNSDLRFYTITFNYINNTKQWDYPYKTIDYTWTDTPKGASSNGSFQAYFDEVSGIQKPILVFDKANLNSLDWSYHQTTGSGYTLNTNLYLTYENDKESEDSILFNVGSQYQSEYINKHLLFYKNPPLLNPVGENTNNILSWSGDYRRLETLAITPTTLHKIVPGITASFKITATDQNGCGFSDLPISVYSNYAKTTKVSTGTTDSYGNLLVAMTVPDTAILMFEAQVSGKYDEGASGSLDLQDHWLDYISKPFYLK